MHFFNSLIFLHSCSNNSAIGFCSILSSVSDLDNCLNSLRDSLIIVLIFYILTIYGIFILRKKMPNADRPYKAFGYPFLPMLYIVIASAICISLLITKFSTCGWGVLIMLTGIPVYYLNKPKEE